MKNRFAAGNKEPDYRVKRCKVLQDGTPCDRPFAFYVHDGIQMCSQHDYEWRHHQ
jgi:hypothetical protein